MPRCTARHSGERQFAVDDIEPLGTPGDVEQGVLDLDEPGADRSRLMGAIDALNGRYGRSTSRWSAPVWPVTSGAG